MNIIFFVALLSMLLAAATIVAVPLRSIGGRREAGFAKTPLLIALVVIAASIALYSVLGRPDLATAGDESPTRAMTGSDARPMQSPASAGAKAGTVESLLGGLEERLEQNPDDGKGWLLLAKSYAHLGRTDDAAEAYAKAQALGEVDAEFEAGLAGGAPVPASASPVSIRGSVKLSERATAQVSPQDAVFIIAKSLDGSPMPLAVLRRTAGEIPFEFTLDDSHSMVQGRGISNAGRLSVTAKISASGDALATSSTLSTPSLIVDPNDNAPVELVIDVSDGTPD